MLVPEPNFVHVVYRERQRIRADGKEPILVRLGLREKREMQERVADIRGRPFIMPGQEPNVDRSMVWGIPVEWVDEETLVSVS